MVSFVYFFSDILVNFFLAFSIDVISIFIFSYLLYYRKHRDREGLISYLLFNVFLFVIIYFLAHLDVSMTIGFAIFGLLGLVRLRSDSFNKIDITYFIGALTLAIINGLVRQISLLCVANGVVLGVTFAVDYYLVAKKYFRKLLYTLDTIPPTLFTNKNETIQILSKQLNMSVIDYEIIQINSVKDSVDLFLTYKSDD